MKTLSKITIILIAALSLSIFTIKGNTTPGEIKKAKEAEKTIRHFFKFPGILVPLHDLNKPETQKVEVLFSTDQNGNINFVLAKTADRSLRTEIERQFWKLRLAGLKRDVVNSVVLNFKTL